MTCLADEHDICDIFAKYPSPMRYIPALVLALTSLASLAQAPLRVEIEAKKYAEDFHIVAVGKNGMLLFYESQERSSNGSRDWVFTKYDTEFKEVWTKEQPVKNGLDFVDFVIKEDKDVYLLLGNKYGTGAEGISKGNYEIVNVNLESSSIRSINGRIPTSSIMDHFDVVNGYGYLSGIEVP